MTSRKARIPANAGEEIIFSDDQWKSVEQAYGHSLSPEIRAHIYTATEALRLVGSAERNAPLKKMIEKTKDLRDAAQSLLQEADCPVKEDSDSTSFEALTEDLATVVKEFRNDDLQFLLMVHQMVTGCNLMLRTWETDGGLRAGSIWDAWVQSINELMQHHGLPSAARNDSDADKPYPDRPSSEFVSLIFELQKQIPINLRRHQHEMVTNNALAKAIQRARRSNWWPELLPPSIRKKYESFLESPEQRNARYKSFEDRLRMDPNWVQTGPTRFERVEMLELKRRIQDRHEKTGERKPGVDDGAQ